MDTNEILNKLKSFLIFLLVNITASRLKARHLLAADATSANTNSTRDSVRTLEDRLCLNHLLLGGFAVEIQPFVLLGFTFFLQLGHSLLLLELLLLQVLFVVGSNSLVAVLGKDFNSDFVLFQILDVSLTFVLICIEDDWDVAIVCDGFNCSFVESELWVLCYVI